MPSAGHEPYDPFVRYTSTLAGLALIACSEAASPVADAGDAGAISAPDATAPRPDAGPDGGFRRRDAGFPDAGFSDRATLAEGEILLEGARTYIHVRGAATSTQRTTVFVTTGPTVGHEYLIAPMSFLEDERLLAYFDLHSTGRSGRAAVGTATASVDGHVRQLSDFIDYLDREFQGESGAPVHLVGHGYGAAVAARLASQRPASVEALVLINPYPIDVQQQAEWYQEGQARLTGSDRAVLDQIRADPRPCVLDYNSCSLLVWETHARNWTCPETRDSFEDLNFEYANLGITDSIRDELLRARYDWRPGLANVTARTTLIQGGCDVRADEILGAYREALPNARVVPLPGSGHFPMVEAAAEFQAALKQSLE